MKQLNASPRLTGLLGFNGGYVDTAGFLALHGLFTAHVTGNFVTLAASLVYGTSGALAKLSALPVFCALVLLARLSRSVDLLLGTKIVLLAAAALIMIAYGPFPDSGTGLAFSAGMLMVAAMAIQNAVHRMHLANAPPSTLMTGTTTQVMLDLADLLRGVDAPERAAAQQRLRKLVPAVVIFAFGCAMAALAYIGIGMWCFALPPIVAAAIAVESGR